MLYDEVSLSERFPGRCYGLEKNGRFTDSQTGASEMAYHASCGCLASVEEARRLCRTGGDQWNWGVAPRRGAILSRVHR